MTAQTHEFLGHKMLLMADGNALIQCRWLLSTTDATHSNPTLQEMEVIEMAVTQISEYLKGERTEFSVPLRMSGTDFRIKVWDEMQKIPYGETVSYKELSQRIGSPKACRAVANACGANPFPILIPCHRVVGSEGKLGGYTGGLDIKMALLKLEQGNYY